MSGLSQAELQALLDADSELAMVADARPVGDVRPMPLRDPWQVDAATLQVEQARCERVALLVGQSLAALWGVKPAVHARLVEAHVTSAYVASLDAGLLSFSIEASDAPQRWLLVFDATLLSLLMQMHFGGAGNASLEVAGSSHSTGVLTSRWAQLVARAIAATVAGEDAERRPMPQVRQQSIAELQDELRDGGSLLVTRFEIGIASFPPVPFDLVLLGVTASEPRHASHLRGSPGPAVARANGTAAIDADAIRVEVVAMTQAVSIALADIADWQCGVMLSVPMAACACVSGRMIAGATLGVSGGKRAVQLHGGPACAEQGVSA